MENYKAEKKKINGLFLLLCVTKALIVALGYAAGYIIAYFSKTDTIYGKVIMEVYSYNTVAGVLFEIGSGLLAAAVPLVIYFAVKGKGSFKETVMLSRPTFFQVGYALGATVLISDFFSRIGTSVIYSFYTLFGFNPSEYYFPVGNPQNVWLLPFFFILIALLPALLEEFVFRGAVMGGMRKFGRVFVIIMSGVLFMMMHGSIEQYPLALSAGICLAYFTFKFKSVWVAVLVHFIINLDACIFILMVEYLDGLAFAVTYMLYTLTYFAVMLAFAVAGPILYGVRLPAVGAPTAEEKKGRARLVFTSPFFYIFIALFLFVTADSILMVVGSRLF